MSESAPPPDLHPAESAPRPEVSGMNGARTTKPEDQCVDCGRPRDEHFHDFNPGGPVPTPEDDFWAMVEEAAFYVTGPQEERVINLVELRDIFNAFMRVQAIGQERGQEEGAQAGGLTPAMIASLGQEFFAPENLATLVSGLQPLIASLIGKAEAPGGVTQFFARAKELVNAAETFAGVLFPKPAGVSIATAGADIDAGQAVVAQADGTVTPVSAHRCLFPVELDDNGQPERLCGRSLPCAAHSSMAALDTKDLR